MTDKDLKNIYEYMGWKTIPRKKYEATPEGGLIMSHIQSYPKILDSNSAWEVVQEMERKKHLRTEYPKTDKLTLIAVGNLQEINDLTNRIIRALDVTASVNSAINAPLKVTKEIKCMTCGKKLQCHDGIVGEATAVYGEHSGCWTFLGYRCNKCHGI